MAKRSAAREIRNSLKLVNNLSNLSAKDFMRAVDEWRQKVILTVLETGDLNPITQDVIKQKIVEVNRQFEQKFEEQLSENQRRLFVKGIQTVDNALKGGNIQSAVPFLSEQKLEALKRYGAEHIKALTETARHRIAQEIDLAVLGQKSQQDLIEAIGRNLKSSSVFGTLAKRAEVIVKTEVNRINQIASADRLKQTSEQIKDLRKQWIHSFVGIPRPGHLALHRVMVLAKEKFELVGADGRLYLVDGPMDPILPVGDVVNCFPRETLVDAREIQAAFRAQYSGELITVVTARGHKLTGTPNHPILTPFGFSALGQLNQGEDVLCCALGKSMTMTDPNIRYVPTSIKQIFDSLSCERMSQRMLGSGMDFYGDIVDGDIDIVWSASELWYRTHASASKPLSKSDFDGRDFRQSMLPGESLFMKFFWRSFFTPARKIGFVGQLPFLTDGQTTHSQERGFSPITNLNPRLCETIEKNGPIDIVPARKFLKRNTRFVLFDDVMDRERKLISAEDNAMFSQSPPNDFGIQSKSASNPINALTGFIMPDRIIQLSRSQVNSLHVYTLETSSGIYNANGILASNCKCKVIPVVERFQQRETSAIDFPERTA